MFKRKGVTYLDKEDVGSGFGESDSNCLSDPPGPACDQSRVSFQREHVGDATACRHGHKFIAVLGVRGLSGGFWGHFQVLSCVWERCKSGVCIALYCPVIYRLEAGIIRIITQPSHVIIEARPAYRGPPESGRIGCGAPTGKQDPNTSSTSFLYRQSETWRATRGYPTNLFHELVCNSMDQPGSCVKTRLGMHA